MVAGLAAAIAGAAFAGAGERTVTVGIYQNPPKIFLSTPGRQPAGILWDILTRVAARHSWRLRPVPCAWDQCLARLRSGKLDVMPDVAYSDRRARTLDFGAVPALYSWSEFYRAPQVVLNSIKDLAGKRIAVLKGSVQESYLGTLIHEYGLRDVTLLPVATLAEGFQMTADGETDAVATNYLYGNSRARRYGLDRTPITFQPAQLYYATARGRNADVLAAIDQTLNRWQSSPGSYYYRTLAKWEGPPPPPPGLRRLWLGLGGLGFLLILSVLAIAWQRRMVAEKTRHIRITEEKLALILDNVDAHILIKDPQSRYQYVNRRTAEFLGAAPEEIIGRDQSDFFDAEIVQRLQAADREVIEAGQVLVTETSLRSRANPEDRAYLVVRQPLRDTRGQVYALCTIATDFTDHKLAQEKISQLAFYDPLTGLPNRALFLERARHALNNFQRTGAEGALLYIDLDNFKVLNDTRGHSKGDDLLTQVARRLSTTVRANDTLARLGGDEFVLLMENLDPDCQHAMTDAERVGTKVLQALRPPFALDGFTHTVSASIGIAMFSDAGNRVDELLRRADMAMYDAKNDGRDRLKFFNSAMQDVLDKRTLLETELREAIRHQDFVLYYQPQIDAEGALIGMEALVRWNHPDRGIQPPRTFIPLAESTGMILQLGDWIVRSACRQLALWRNHPRLSGATLAVNVSARQLHDPDFVPRVLAALDEAGAPPERLQIELTESQLIDDTETLIGRMLALREHGIRFSLDDFGAGYSSLSHLKRLPLNHLKIDQSFVRDLLTDPNDAAIVRTILALGQSLDLAVIAEGVETFEQRDILLKMGCTRFQGYLFGRPSPVQILEADLAARLNPPATP